MNTGVDIAVAMMAGGVRWRRSGLAGRSGAARRTDFQVKVRVFFKDGRKLWVARNRITELYFTVSTARDGADQFTTRS